MITQIQQQAGNGVGELPDYESSLQNLMRLDQTLQKLDGLLGKDMGPKYRDRFKKKRLIKQNDHNNTNTNSSIRAIWKPKFLDVLLCYHRLGFIPVIQKLYFLN